MTEPSVRWGGGEGRSHPHPSALISCHPVSPKSPLDLPSSKPTAQKRRTSSPQRKPPGRAQPQHVPETKLEGARGQEKGK